MNKEIKGSKASLLKATGFSKEVGMVENDICPICERFVDHRDFRDTLSKNEWRISGMCQDCQNSIFVEVPEKL